MNTQMKTLGPRSMVAVLAAATLPILAPELSAADSYTNAFDTADSINGWTHWWGAAMETREFDPTMDADGNPNSGSMKVQVPYSRANGGDNQFSMWGSFSGSPGTWTQPLDGTAYTNLSMDIFWDPGSPTRPSGDYGNDFRWGFAVGAPIYGQIPFNTHTTIAATDVGHWFHLTAPINLATVGPNINNIVGVWIKMWTGSDPASALNDGTATFWVDNIRLHAIATNAPPPPPPTLGIEKTIPGLKIFASAAGSQYQRQSIRTINPAYSWISGFDPVTYSITISEYPGSTYSGFQTHLFIVPGTSIATNQTSPDYSEPNVVFLDIQNQANGGAFANFRYKVDETNGNAMIYGSGTIAGIGAPSIRGTWSLTFDPAGLITLTAPNGANTNFSMPAEHLAPFNAPAYAYFGIQPNQPGNIGQSATLARLQITGVPTPIDDDFSGPGLNTTIWQVVAEDVAGLVTVPPDAAFWLTWTLPDRDFVVQVAEDLNFDLSDWNDFPLTGTQIGNRKRTVVLNSQLPPNFTGNYFFRMIMRPAAP